MILFFGLILKKINGLMNIITLLKMLPILMRNQQRDHKLIYYYLKIKLKLY